MYRNVPTIKYANRKIGFTIVELLIVIVFIAILAAITVVAYNGIQNRTHDTTVRSDISNATKKLEITRAQLGHYPEDIAEFDSGFKFSKNAYATTEHNVLYCINFTTNNYALGLISKSSKTFLTVSGITTEGATVTPTSVCAAVGKTWVNDATTRTAHGYIATGTGWSSSWAWTK